MYNDRGVYQNFFHKVRVRVRVRILRPGLGLGLGLGVKVRFYMISGIAIVSKTNEPVILRTYVDAEDVTPTTSGRKVGNPDDHPACPQMTVTSAELRLHHVIYCSLDDEAWTAGKGKRNDMFIGHLNAMDNFRWVVFVMSLTPWVSVYDTAIGNTSDLCVCMFLVLLTFFVLVVLCTDFVHLKTTTFS